MEVELVSGTDNPDETVALAARGDYMNESPWMGEADPYDDVSVDDDAIETVIDNQWDMQTGLGPERAAAVYSLLRRLFRQRHFGPFEHAQATFGVEGVSRVTMAQLTRHRHATFDVQSMRYVEFDDDPGMVTPKSLTDTDHATREGVVDVDDAERPMLTESVWDAYQECVDTYQELLDNGVPAEDARYVLPLGTTVNLTVSANLRSLSHIFDLRRAADAQWEITELAEAMADELHEWAPISAHLIDEHGPFANAP